MGKQQTDDKHEQPLQAVLIAATFDNAWHPITLEAYDGSGSVDNGGKGKERPLVLCPLNNVPLLKHSIDFLQGAGVRELFLISTHGTEALEQFLNAHASSTTHSPTTDNNSNKHTFHRSNSTNTSHKISWSSKLTISLLKFTDCTNIGDALRELDRRNVIKSDPFILMQSDVITNVDLRTVLELHEARKKKDNSAIMTVLLSDVGGWGYNDDTDENPNSPYDIDNNGVFCPPLRGSTDDLFLALDTTRGMDEARILLWENHPSKSKAAIPTSFFVENSSNITLTRNLLDIGLDICSPDVLARFSDEFDYRELRSQFVANCVSEEEIGLQSRIFGYTLRRGEYAGRPLGDMRRYHTVCMDVLRRWCYPLVPDNYHNRGKEKGKVEGAVANYVCERHYVYHDDCKTDNLRSHVGRSTQLLGPLLVGPNNYIGEHCCLQRSTLGPNCKVMDHCSIVDCHLWGDVVIEEGAKLNGVIVCEGGIVKKGAVVERGCVIGKGCIVGESVTLMEFTRITLAQEEEEEDDFSGFDDSSSEEESSEEESDSDGKDVTEERAKSTELATAKGITNHDVVGPDGLGRVWTPSPPDEYDSDEEDDAEAAQAAAIELMKSQSIGFDMTLIYKKWKQLQMEDEDNFSEEGRGSDDEDDGMDVDDEWNNDDILDRKAATHLDEEGMEITGRQKGVDVVRELRDICLEHETSSPVENLRIELNSFKFSQNATYADCCKGAIMAVIDKILEEADNPSPGKLVASLKKKLEYWGPLFHSICMGAEEEKAIIHALEIMALGTGKGAAALGTEPAFRFVLQTLHDQEIVNEEAIFEWAGERKDEGIDTPLGKLFRQKPTQDFLEWLEQESDDDSGSEDDDDSD
ncbi:hypothetical protein ACHAWO_007504 [Cyclotella atomus]|uniref:Translation initiation factor eIF2B subunit epsilon n=1 Tax=Cyclotella atomus TaxID=382360 RepID=A0ABD3P3L6_9STRA